MTRGVVSGAVGKADSGQTGAGSVDNVARHIIPHEVTDIISVNLQKEKLSISRERQKE
jgi:hypothetical protein